MLADTKIKGRTMITIRNMNENYGDQTEFSGNTLEEAVASMQDAIRSCGTEYANVEVVQDDYETVSRYTVRDESGCEVPIEAESPHEAAQEYVDTGDWEESLCTCFIHLEVRADDSEDWERIRIAIDPTPPPCEMDEDHEWTSPWRIVGGLKENPGVWGNGGGVRITEVCQKCGCGKNTDTWATDPYDGSQGNTIVSYEPDQFSEAISEMESAE